MQFTACLILSWGYRCQSSRLPHNRITCSLKVLSVIEGRVIRAKISTNKQSRGRWYGMVFKKKNRKLFRFAGNFFIWQEIIFICLEIISFGRNAFCLTVNYFLWQEIISFGRKFFILTGNYFPWLEIISFGRKLFPLAGTYSFGNKLFRFAGNYFALQEIISLCRKLFHLAGNNFHFS